MASHISIALPEGSGSSDFKIPLSGNGRYLMFASNRPLVDGYRDIFAALYVQDLATGKIELATVNAAGVHDGGYAGALSADGRLAVYYSDAGILLKNLASGALTRVDTSAGGVVGNLGVSEATISANGRYVAFASRSSNLAGSDANGSNDIFVKDVLTGAIVNASTRADGTQAENESRGAVVSDDGKLVLFVSASTNLDARATTLDDRLYLKNLSTGELSLVAVNAAGELANGWHARGVMSRDGTTVAFTSSATNLVPSARDGNLFVKNLITGDLVVASSDASGKPSNATADGARLSADGRLVAFTSWAGNLVDGDTNQKTDVFVKNLLSGAIRRVSVGNDGAQSNADARMAEMSHDGKVVTFTSEASTLVPGDTVGSWNVFKVDVDPAFASAWSDTRYGGSGNDVLSGGNGDQYFSGLGGNDRIDGGAGTDLMGVRGLRADYTLARDGATITLHDTKGRDGTDTLSGVERLRFADGSVALDHDGIAGQAYRIYQAAFNRTPDKGGLGFWMHFMDGGMTVDQVAAGFMASPEFIAMYGATPSNAQLVDKLYQNVLHREGEAQGVKFWNDALDSKMITQAQALAMFSESPENQAALIGVIEGGISYDPYV